VNNAITLTLLGLVKSPFKTNTPPEEIRPQPAQIVINPDYAPGLLGLEPGTDILVLFYLHLIQPDETPLQLHPRHDPANPLRGVFATRTQFRPNALGVSVVRLEAIEDNVLTVIGLDALDGSPVVDIKPYLPWFDADTHRQQFEVTPVSSLAEARAAIDRLDAEVIRLLGNRAGYVRQVVNFKQTTEEVRAPARYAEVMRRRREMAQAAGLNPDVVEGMYKLLVDSFIQEEIELLRLRGTQGN
jgi:tRNA-Thr(GGU) m(6)t(6)A37 methyltransferase TsaA